MNRDLFLAILAMDSYNRGHTQKLLIQEGDSLSDQDEIGRKIGDATITESDLTQKAKDAGFYAIAYDWNGETVVSYRGTDGLNDVTKGWTIGAGWTDQEQINFAA